MLGALSLTIKLDHQYSVGLDHNRAISTTKCRSPMSDSEIVVDGERFVRGLNVLLLAGIGNPSFRDGASSYHRCHERAVVIYGVFGKQRHNTRRIVKLPGLKIAFEPLVELLQCQMAIFLLGRECRRKGTDV